ncbi:MULTISPECIES: CBM35 domain-containing protein [unclassified Streptomyces]|uniref:CBM35 domain-containing protein n=1 Tax=unclassified Streptomyces TaxID=2593676 RepID=UPI00225BFA61|nr:carbohydrate-binding protein [Streptomyces sp. NBC_00047]MCX5606550.1 carbohydrate-binding protein [Streptomyces sp. NBC_00047]
MTTPANNGPHGGANKPEDDDPFGYLYEDGQAAGATPPGQGGAYGYPGPAAGGPSGAQRGVPRTSHHQVRTVGERRNGGAQRGQVPAQPAPAYQAQYQAPEALQAGGYGVPPQQQPPQHQTQSIAHSGGHGGHGGHGGGGSSRKGLLIAAVAVVAAVAIGIGAAVAFGNKDGKDKNGAAKGNQQSTAPQNSSSPAPSAPQPSEAPLPKADFAGAGMSLTGGAMLQNTVPGAKSAGGQYVGGLNALGAAATWTLDVPKAGGYKLKMTYGVPGKDANTTLTINGEAQSRPINMKNFSKAAEGDWAKGWTNTYSIVQLKQGSNAIKISCEAGNQCDVLLDQLWLEKE